MDLYWFHQKITIFAIRQNKPIFNNSDEVNLAIFDKISLKWAYFDNLKMSLNWLDE